MSATASEARSPAPTAGTGSSAGRDRFGPVARVGERIGWPLVLLALAALLIQGGVFIQKSWLWTGDTIYHRALMAAILAGELMPGGPYAGLPAFYSPLFHYLAAGSAALFRLDPLDGVKLVSILAAPATPLAAFYLARTLSFDRTVALVAAFFATFGGGLLQASDRVWVDALFTGQHNFFPFFPRDGAFLLLPLGLAWTFRAVLDGWRPGAFLAGLAFGLMVLVHTQTAVFAAPVVLLYLALLIALRRELWPRAVRVSLVVAGLTLLLSSFWWVWMLVSIVQSGSFSVQMPADRVPVKLELIEFPLEFGVFLPLGLLGLVLTARRLARQRDPAALLLLVWWAAPVLLAVLRPTDFPGGDTFFPRRLWQFASQPLAIMAAAALIVGVVRPLRLRGAQLTATLGAVFILAGVPGSWGTWQRIGEFWNTTSFADTDFDLAGNFAYGPWLAQQARAEGLRTVLAPTPDATMVWYYSGQKVVYLYPTAAIKLAFDVRKLTGFGTDERQADLMAAYAGNPERLADVAHKYDAAYVVLRRQDDRLALVDLPAAAIRGRKGPWPVERNHYEYLSLGRDDDVEFNFSSPTDGQATVALRARRRSQAPRISSRLTVNGVEFPINEGETPRDDYAEVTRTVPVRAGQNDVRFEAAASFELARFVAYTGTPTDVDHAFIVAYQDPFTVVLTPR